jgi:transposase
MKKTTITKSLKFHTSENSDKSEKLKSFLTECIDVGNRLIELHFGWKIETNKYDFINQTKDYNIVYFKIRSHHFQQVQEKVFNTIWLQYEQAIKATKFTDPKLNYLRYFCFKWDNVDKWLEKKKGDFYNQLSDFWKKDKEKIIQIIEKSVRNKIQKGKVPKLKKLALKVDTRTSSFEPSKTSTHFDCWFSIITNTKIKNKYEKINIPIKWSNWHEKNLTGTKLNNSFIVKWDSVYDRFEIIGTFTQENTPLLVSKPCNSNCLGVDVGVSNLLTFSNGYQVDTQALQKELEKFLIYEKQVKRLQSKNNYDSKKYLKKQIQISNKIENIINGCLNNIPNTYEYVVFEDLNFKDKLSRKTNYLIKRFKVQGILNKAELKQRHFKIQKINPAYTSQQCNFCNFTDKSNRKTQSEFICKNCSYTQNADINAALNIKERFLDVRFKQLNYKGQIKKFLKELFEADQVCHNQTSQLSTGFT